MQAKAFNKGDGDTALLFDIAKALGQVQVQATRNALQATREQVAKAESLEKVAEAIAGPHQDLYKHLLKRLQYLAKKYAEECAEFSKLAEKEAQ